MGTNRATNKNAEALVMNIAPDVCLTPVGSAMVPVPYAITCKFDVAEKTTGTVNYAGDQAFTMDSRLPTVKGDEPGTGGGVVSGVNLGYCRPIAHSGTVRAEKSYVVRHGDMMHMNCNGPDGPGNTFGKIIYIGFQIGNIPPGGKIDKLEQTITTEDGKTTIETKKELVDPETGERTTVHEHSEITTDPQTGEVTVDQRTQIDGPNGTVNSEARTVVDPNTGSVEHAQINQTTGPDAGSQTTWEQNSYNPGQDSATFQSGTGEPPPDFGSNVMDSGGGIQPGGDGAVLGNDMIGQTTADGRVYLGDGMYANPNELQPLDTSPPATPPAVSDADVMGDPAVQAALDEQAALQAEMDQLTKELAWTAAQTAVDLAGLVDPTPTSDVIGAGMALADGDLIGAGLSVVSIIPWLGDAVAKPFKGARAAKRVKQLKEAAEKIKLLLDKAGKKVRDAIEAAKKKLKKPKGPPEGKPPGGGGGDGGHVPKKPNKLEQIREQKRLEALKKKRADAEAKGKHKQPHVSKEEEKWLAENERNRDLAYDPATDSFKVDEAQAALDAEAKGLIDGPVTRASRPDGTEGGDDFFDGNMKPWDAKSASDAETIKKTLEGGESVLVHGTQSQIDNVIETVGTSDDIIYVVIGGGG